MLDDAVTGLFQDVAERGAVVAPSFGSDQHRVEVAFGASADPVPCTAQAGGWWEGRLVAQRTVDSDDGATVVAAWVSTATTYV